tara:strand:- start:748 stop:999 length:252 start_codon:yes stop_codon:yes gene_type:complete
MKKIIVFTILITSFTFAISINSNARVGCIGFCQGVQNNGLCQFGEASGDTCINATPEEIIEGYKVGKLPCNVSASLNNTCPPI